MEGLREKTRALPYDFHRAFVFASWLTRAFALAFRRDHRSSETREEKEK
jgi:hypothetical protein